MPFDWTEFLEVSEFINSNVGNCDFSEEAAERCAVGRIYYALFGYTRDYDKVGYRRSNKGKDHQDLIKRLYFINWGDIATRLDSLRKLRNYCDYKDYEMGDPEWLNTKELLDKSKKIRDYIVKKIV